MLQHTRKYIRFEMIYIFLFTFKTKYYRWFLLLFALFCVTSIFFPSFLAYEFVDVRFVTKKTESSNDDETVLSKITDLKIKYLWTVSLSETTKCRKDSQNHFFCFSFLFLLSSKKKRTRKGIDVTVYTVHEICAFEISCTCFLLRGCDWKGRTESVCMRVFHANASCVSVCVCDCKNFNLNEFSFAKVIIDLYANEAMKCVITARAPVTNQLQSETESKAHRSEWDVRMMKCDEWKEMKWAMTGEILCMEMDEMHTHWW